MARPFGYVLEAKQDGLWLHVSLGNGQEGAIALNTESMTGKYTGFIAEIGRAHV